MSPKFKILNKKNIYDGFFEMNEVTLKYKKYDGNWSNEVKTKMNKKEILNGLTLIALQWFFLNIELT